MSYILLTITVFLLSLSNLWLWLRVTKLEDNVHLITKRLTEIIYDSM
jgi:hypothetical protein